MTCFMKKFEEDVGKSIRLQAIVPISQRRTVSEICHDVNTTTHLGGNKTLARIRQNFYWPGLQPMYAYILLVVRNAVRGKVFK